MTTAWTIALAADGALPRRDDLLDVGCIGHRLSAVLVDGRRRSIDSVSVVRVNYHPGKTIRAVYRIAVAGASHTVAARMFADAQAAERVYHRAAAVARPVDTLRGVVHDPLLRTVFWTFPNDRKIACLTDAVAAVPPEVNDGRRVSRRLVAYAPEKAATFACETTKETRVAYVKVTADDQAHRDRRTYDRLRSALDPHDGSLRLPKPLSFSDDPRVLWLEPVIGRRIAASLGTDVELRDLERLGMALAAFHGLPPADAPRFERCSPSHIDGDVAMLDRVRPDIGEAARALGRRLIDAAVIDSDVACLHGDLHPKNAIAVGDAMALIDVENVAAGPAAADLGSLLASLVYRRQTRRLSARGCRARARAFLVGYASRRDLPSRQSLAWYIAAALFRERAVRAVRRIRPLGLYVLPALLTTSERLLQFGLEDL